MEKFIFNIWNYFYLFICFIYVFTIQGIASFITLSSENHICIAVSEKILRNSRPEDFDRIVERLGTKHNARGVILFVDEDNVR